MSEEQDVGMVGPSRQQQDEVPRRTIDPPQCVPLGGVPQILKCSGIVVDANNPNITVTSSTEVQVPQETNNKIRVVKFIAHAHQKILLHFFPKNADARDLNIGDQIHNVLFTTYTMLRQHHNQTGGTLERRTGETDFKIRVDGTEITRAKGPIKDLVAAEAIAHGVPFAKYEQSDPKNWYGIANPLLNFLSGFALRKKELSLGHHFMPVEKRYNQQKDVELSEYGIYGVHHLLCEGISFPPMKRVSMSQTVGPLTALLCYIKDDTRYSQKWANAVKKAFAHFPEIDIIMQIIKEKEPAEIRTLIYLISEVALIVTPREVSRMFPPPAAFSYIFTKESHKCGTSTYNTADLLPLFNLSGPGAFAFYKIFMHYSWKMRLYKGTDSVAKQICYHSMFGTFKEDLGVLGQITDQATWNTREEMGEVFSNAEGAIIIFDPIKQKFYPKLSQANQIGLLTSSNSQSHYQLSSISCFSGKSKRKFDDAFIGYLTSEKNKPVCGRSLLDLISRYTELREKLRAMLKSQNGVLDAVKTVWNRLDDTSTSHDTEEPDMVVHATGKYFLGKSYNYLI